jgi:hypothetical protein
MLAKAIRPQISFEIPKHDTVVIGSTDHLLHVGEKCSTVDCASVSTEGALERGVDWHGKIFGDNQLRACGCSCTASRSLAFKHAECMKHRGAHRGVVDCLVVLRASSAPTFCCSIQTHFSQPENNKVILVWSTLVAGLFQKNEPNPRNRSFRVSNRIIENLGKAVDFLNFYFLNGISGFVFISTISFDFF